MSRLLFVVLGIFIGVLIGQTSTFYAINPERLRDEAFKVAGLSYKYGCMRATNENDRYKGWSNKCVVYAYDFEELLRKQLPIDEKDL